MLSFQILKYKFLSHFTILTLDECIHAVDYFNYVMKMKVCAN